MCLRKKEKETEKTSSMVRNQKLDKEKNQKCTLYLIIIHFPPERCMRSLVDYLRSEAQSTHAKPTKKPIYNQNKPPERPSLQTIQFMDTSRTQPGVTATHNTKNRHSIDATTSKKTLYLDDEKNQSANYARNITTEHAQNPHKKSSKIYLLDLLENTHQQNKAEA